MSKHDIFQIMNDYHSDNEILKSEAKKAVIEDDIVNIGLHFFLKDVRPMLPPVMNHSIAVA